MKKPQIWDHKNRETGKVTPKVHMRSERELHLDAMIEGLCSRHWRGRYDTDLDAYKDIPTTLSLTEVWETVREEYDARGDDSVWTWSDPIDSRSAEKGRGWARELILAVIPGLEDTMNNKEGS